MKINEMAYPFNTSVIIPTFNRKDILLKTLSCLNQQTVTADHKFEVIVVDDGSTDDTESATLDFVKHTTLIYHLKYYNTQLTDVFGTSVARNTGIKNAAGKWLLFLDDDCLPHPEWINAHVNALEQGAKIVLGYYSNIETKLTESLPIKMEESRANRLHEASLNNTLTELASANFSISRECIEKCGMFDERFARKEGYGYEDIEFGHRCVLGDFKMSFCADALTYAPVNSDENQASKDKQAHKAKRLWWHIIQHPQQNLPITPLLLKYAEKKKQELNAKRIF